MDRKDFLIKVWKNFMKPFLLLSMLFFSVRFFLSVYNEVGSARQITFALMILSIFCVVFYFVKMVLQNFTDRIYSELSGRAKFNLKVIRKLAEYVLVLIFGVLLYKVWTENQILALIYLIVFLAERIYIIVKEEKLKVVKNQF